MQATGNAQNLRLNINAPALYEIYAGLRGRAYGYLNIQSQPRLRATANLAVDNFGFKDLIDMRKLRIVGQLPTSETTPSLLTAKWKAEVVIVKFNKVKFHWQVFAKLIY